MPRCFRRHPPASAAAAWRWAEGREVQLQVRLRTERPSARVAAEIPSLPMPVWKRTLDVALGLVVGLAVLPLIVLIAVAVVLDSPGNPFYRHDRVGRGGRIFSCWKFRSMYVGADRDLAALLSRNEASGHIFKMRDDPRRTRVGRILRKTSLDELPQLWNVLRGDMSFVGPRPPLPSEVKAYSAHHLRRLEGTPGITGLWQVSARERFDFDEMVDLDIDYLSRIALKRDLLILVLTIPVVVLARGSH